MSGVTTTHLVEMARIAPPVGMNIFAIQGLTGKKLGAMVKAAFPVFLLMVAFAFMIASFPGIVMFLLSRLWPGHAASCGMAFLP